MLCGLTVDIQTELVLAIYEVGQSFFRGWGVQKDKEMAVVCAMLSTLTVPVC